MTHCTCALLFKSSTRAFSTPLPTQSHYIEMATRKLWASKPACEDRLYNFLSNGLMRTLS